MTRPSAGEYSLPHAPKCRAQRSGQRQIEAAAGAQSRSVCRHFRLGREFTDRQTVGQIEPAVPAEDQLPAEPDLAGQSLDLRVVGFQIARHQAVIVESRGQQVTGAEIAAPDAQFPRHPGRRLQSVGPGEQHDLGHGRPIRIDRDHGDRPEPSRVARFRGRQGQSHRDVVVPGHRQHRPGIALSGLRRHRILRRGEQAVGQIFGAIGRRPSVQVVRCGLCHRNHRFMMPHRRTALGVRLCGRAVVRQDERVSTPGAGRGPADPAERGRRVDPATGQPMDQNDENATTMLARPSSPPGPPPRAPQSGPQSGPQWTSPPARPPVPPSVPHGQIGYGSANFGPDRDTRNEYGRNPYQSPPQFQTPVQPPVRQQPAPPAATPRYPAPPQSYPHPNQPPNQSSNSSSNSQPYPYPNPPAHPAGPPAPPTHRPPSRPTQLRARQPHGTNPTSSRDQGRRPRSRPRLGSRPIPAAPMG